MSHVWVSQDWIASLGLAQYSRTFEEQLIDGRLLNVLTKKDLYKYLKIHKKFHQMSIAYGVELLRSLDFDKDVSGMFSHLNFVSKFRLIRGTEIASCNRLFLTKLLLTVQAKCSISASCLYIFFSNVATPWVLPSS